MWRGARDHRREDASTDHVARDRRDPGPAARHRARAVPCPFGGSAGHRVAPRGHRRPRQIWPGPRAVGTVHGTPAARDRRRVSRAAQGGPHRRAAGRRAFRRERRDLHRWSRARLRRRGCGHRVHDGLVVDDFRDRCGRRPRIPTGACPTPGDVLRWLPRVAARAAVRVEPRRSIHGQGDRAVSRAQERSMSAAQPVKFVLVGAAGYVINLAVFTALLRLGVPYVVDAIVSYFISNAVMYVGNRYYTFALGHAGFWAAYVRYFAVGLVIAGLNAGVLVLLVEGLGLRPTPA